MTQDFDQANAEFWNSLCSSNLAASLGITEFSLPSLKRFDHAYFDYYPYLLQHVEPASLAGNKVLEVGLGYGSLGQKLAEAGADYVGLDVAEGPVRLMNARLSLAGLPGLAIQGSMLRCPLESESLDAVIAIGSFHHTGHVQRCIEETYRILKPDGVAIIMVYNLFSYRQWWRWPKQTLRAWWRGWRAPEELTQASEEQKLAYDAADPLGRGAPNTVFLSIRQLRRMCGKFSSVVFQKENCDNIQLYFPNMSTEAIVNLGVYIFLPRSQRSLSTLGKRVGLDIYIRARR